MKRFILCIVLFFILTGCYDPVMKINFLNKTEHTVQVLTKKNEYIDINHSKLVLSTLVLLYDNSTIVIKNNNVTKEYKFEWNKIFTKKRIELRKKYDHSLHPPLKIEIGKDIYILFPENEKILLLPNK